MTGTPNHADAILSVIEEELARRSSENAVIIFDGLPPVTPRMLTQMLAEIDGQTKGLPSAPNPLRSPSR
jgi:hypothetical protein